MRNKSWGKISTHVSVIRMTELGLASFRLGIRELRGIRRAVGKGRCPLGNGTGNVVYVLLKRNEARGNENNF
jgi:hypothetical protein